MLTEVDTVHYFMKLSQSIISWRFAYSSWQKMLGCFVSQTSKVGFNE